MTWGKVDDKLHSSPKWRGCSKGARALWVTSLSWCMDQLTDGHIPSAIVSALGGTMRDARNLVTVGLWEQTETGFVFHDWADYQLDAASIRARREAESVGGLRGNHERWHVGRGVSVEGCQFCASGTRSNKRRVGESGTRSGPRSGQEESGANPPRPLPIKESKSVSGTPIAREAEPPPLETSVPRHVLDSAWTPTTAHKAYAMTRGIDLEHETRQFRAHCKSRRVVSVDFDAEFDKWLGNARSSRAGPGATRPTTDDRVRAGLELAARMRADEAPPEIRRPEIGA